MKRLLKETLQVWCGLLIIGAIAALVILIPASLVNYFGFVLWTIIFLCLWFSFWMSVISVILLDNEENKDD